MDNEQLLPTEHSEIRISTAEADKMEEIKDKLEARGLSEWHERRD